MMPIEWRAFFLGGLCATALALLVSLCGCGGGGPRTELHIGRCGEQFEIPLEMKLMGCAAIQGIYITPDGLNITAIRHTPAKECFGVTKAFPRAGGRAGMVRFARFCATNQTELSTDVFQLTGSVASDGLAMYGYFEIASDDGLATGFAGPCLAEIPTVVFRCTTDAGT